MKNVINYNHNFLYSGYGNPKHYAISAAVGSLIAGIGAAVGGGATAISQYATNSDNQELTREGWDRQEREAARQRIFNRDEAEKAREYYSEEAVMQRRESVGLNTAMVASESATSGPSASGSPASLNAPIPNQAPNIGAVGTAISDAISNYFGFKSTESEIAKAGAETQRLYQDVAFHRVADNMNLRIISTNLSNLQKAGELTDAQIKQVQTLIDAEKHKISSAKVALYNDFMSTRFAGLNYAVNAVQGMHMIEVDYQKMNQYTMELRARIGMYKASHHTEWKSRAKGVLNGNTSEGKDVNQQDGWQKKWQLHGVYDAGTNAHVNAPFVAGLDVHANVEVGGQYGKDSHHNTSETTSQLRMNGYSDEYEEYFVNTRAGQLLCELDACTAELDDVVNQRGRYSKGDWRELRNLLTERIIEINTSYDTWEMLYYNPAHQSTLSSMGQ